jgi:transcriptional regulator with XRE-family HTH domain
MTQMDVARRTELSLQAVGDIERGIVRDPHISSLRQIAYALGVPVEMLVNSEEWRQRLLAPIAPAAIAFNALFKPKVGDNDFTIEDFEQVAEAFVRLDRQQADAVSSEYIHSDQASDEVREAFNRAWVSMYELRYTLDRAHEELMRREAAGVLSIAELIARRDVA